MNPPPPPPPHPHALTTRSKRGRSNATSDSSSHCTHRHGGIRLGFDRSNWSQLAWHFVLAIGIGSSLRLTTYPEATTIAPLYLGDQYHLKTSFLISFGFTKAISNLIVGRVSDVYGRKLPHTIGWIFGVALGGFLLALWHTLTDHSNSIGIGIGIGADGGDADGGDADDFDFEFDDDNHTNRWMWYMRLANICLGAQQGWTWTTNIFMFLDILGPQHRALASAISNSVGYLSSALTTYAAATLSTEAAFRIVLITSLLGCIISTCFVRDTAEYVTQEVEALGSATDDTTAVHHGTTNVIELGTWNLQDDDDDDDDDDDSSTGGNGSFEEDDQVQTCPTMMTDSRKGQSNSNGYDLVSNLGPTPVCNTSEGIVNTSVSSFSSVFIVTCWTNKSTAILCMAGLMANLVTSLAWGLVLIWGKQQQLSSISLANIGSAFTFAKGMVMIFSGYMSDRQKSRKRVLVGGFLVTIVGLGLTAAADLTTDLDTIYIRLLLGGVVIGSGIGSVYCVMTAALSDHTAPQDRASAIGVYKLWRDSGYAFGGILTGWIADASDGSFVTTTTVVALLVGLLVVGIIINYQEQEAKSDKNIRTFAESNKSICSDTGAGTDSDFVDDYNDDEQL